MADTLAEIQALVGQPGSPVRRVTSFDEIPNGFLFYALDKGDVVFERGGDDEACIMNFEADVDNIEDMWGERVGPDYFKDTGAFYFLIDESIYKWED